jgi:hypothetical protein
MCQFFLMFWNFPISLPNPVLEYINITLYTDIYSYKLLLVNMFMYNFMLQQEWLSGSLCKYTKLGENNRWDMQ